MLKYKLIVHDVDADEDDQSLILAGYARDPDHLALITYEGARLVHAPLHLDEPAEDTSEDPDAKHPS